MLKIDHASIEAIPKEDNQVGIRTIVQCHGHLFVFECETEEDFLYMYGSDADSCMIVQNMIEVLPADVMFSEVVDFVKYLGDQLSNSGY